LCWGPAHDARFVVDEKPLPAGERSVATQLDDQM
jgi:hypothetical protein